jgi:cell division protein FtsB
MRILNENVNQIENYDIRKKYLNNEYNDKMFKSILHKREKHNFFLKELFPLALFSYEIAEAILWSMVETAEKYKIISPMTNKVIGINAKGIEQIKKNIDVLKQTASDTNKNMNNLKDDFGYTAKLTFNTNYYFSHYYQ